MTTRLNKKAEKRAATKIWTHATIWAIIGAYLTYTKTAPEHNLQDIFTTTQQYALTLVATLIAVAIIQRPITHLITKHHTNK